MSHTVFFTMYTLYHKFNDLSSIFWQTLKKHEKNPKKSLDKEYEYDIIKLRYMKIIYKEEKCVLFPLFLFTKLAMMTG